MPPMGEPLYECFCGDRFDYREQLIDHNVELHDMQIGESRRSVMQKYPE